MLARHGCDHSGINAVHDDVTDAFAGYGLDVLWQASRMGIALRRLRPATYGADFYGDTLFTREDIARESPGLVRRFLEASAKGWVYALQDGLLRDLECTATGITEVDAACARALATYVRHAAIG